MKKYLSLILCLALCLGLVGCGGFPEVKEAAMATNWYTEAETSNSIIVWGFFEDSVCQSQYFIDGNGQHESTKNTGTYKIKSDVIEIKFDDTDYGTGR